MESNILTTKSRVKLTQTLDTLQFLRTAKTASEGQIFNFLNLALKECEKENMVLLLERVLLHIGDVSRQHNLLKKLNIFSAKGGAQERKIFRACLKWWSINLPESFLKNLNIFVEFTLYENLMYAQVNSDRYKGNISNIELFFPFPEKVQEFIAFKIRKGEDLNLIARHLPKYNTGKLRKTKRVITKSIPKYVVKKNGVQINGETKEKGTTINIRTGDVISYSRDKQSATLNKQKVVNQWISDFCKVMGWDIKGYNEFRKLQNTPEQKFSDKTILDLPKSDFMVFLDRLTGGQRFRVAKMLCRKNGDNLVPNEKWEKLGKYYIEWEKNQEKIASQLREAASNDDPTKTAELLKTFKVKSTGMQSVDLLLEMFKGNLNSMQIDNTYQSLIEKMDIIAGVFPIIDGSGSMSYVLLQKDNVSLKFIDVAFTLAIAFSTRNPVKEFRNTFGWFSSKFNIVGNSKFIDDRPNPYVSKSEFTRKVSTYPVLSETKTFTENFNSIAKSNPGEVSSTNMFSSIEYFVDLVKSGKFHSEDLPNALLYITDNENNTGKSPKEAVALANSIGWQPLLIFWGLQALPGRMKEDLKNVKNVLLVGGFNESCLSQVLRGIKSGSVDPEDELWAIFEDKRYSVLN